VDTSKGGKIDALKQAIVEQVTKFWKAESKALLLSQLGQALTKQGFDLKLDLGGLRLAQFIQEKLRDQLRLLTSPTDSLVKGLVPVSIEVGEEIGSLFAKSATSSSPKNVIRFDKNLWAAFSRPISDGNVRLVSLSPTIAFRDVPPGTATSADEFHVGSDLIVLYQDIEEDQRVAKIVSNITHWFASIGRDIDAGRAKTRDSRTSGLATGSLLGAMFDALEEKDIARVVLPLDVVAKLLSTTITRN
jgi:hypothetical protein